MRLVVTGGGTGGHVFPALEVARTARDKKVHVAYFGSLRGQEVSACKLAEIPFVGFASEPVYSLKSLKGMKAMLALGLARTHAIKELRNLAPDVVFSTGGYSSAPVVSAAQALKIPIVVHEQNAVPGRTNAILGKKSFAVATTFRAAADRFPGCNVVRTGLPVRRELRLIAETARQQDLVPLALVVGGSQGAQSINEAALGAAQRMVRRAIHWLHLTGKTHFEDVFPSYEKLGLKDSYQVKPYLDASEMGAAYARATVVVSRAGAATLSELAAFRIPSVATPYPHAYADHQSANAHEFAEMGAAMVIPQSDLNPASLERGLAFWLDETDRREQAAKALELWDCPDASERIFELIQLASDSRRTK